MRMSGLRSRGIAVPSDQEHSYINSLFVVITVVKYSVQTGPTASAFGRAAAGALATTSRVLTRVREQSRAKHRVASCARGGGGQESTSCCGCARLVERRTRRRRLLARLDRERSTRASIVGGSRWSDASMLLVLLLFARWRSAPASARRLERAAHEKDGRRRRWKREVHVESMLLLD